MPEPNTNIDDIDLGAALAAAFERNPLVPDTIVVNVCEGVVTIEGEVGDSREREEAEAIARRFYGVSGVVNAVTLAARQRPRGSAQDRPALG